MLRAAEAGVEEILASFHGASLFTPRELIVVLDLEGLARSNAHVKALAEGVVALGREMGARSDER